MSKRSTEVNIDAISPMAMQPMEFWHLIEQASDMILLLKAVEKLNWKKLLAYDIRMRLVLLNGLDRILGGAVPTEQHIKELTPRLVIMLLQGQAVWEQLSHDQVDRIDMMGTNLDFDTFFTHVERTYIKKFYYGTGMLRTNPVAVTNGILDFRLLAVSDPWVEIRG